MGGCPKWLWGVLLAVLLASGVWYFAYYARTTEAKIKRALTALCEDASKREGGDGVAGALKLAAMERYFEPRFFVAVDHRYFDGEMTPQEVAGSLVQLRRHTRFARFSVEEIEVFPEKKADEAKAVFTAELTALTQSGEKIDEVRELNCLFHYDRESGRWRIRRIEMNRVLEK